MRRRTRDAFFLSAALAAVAVVASASCGDDSGVGGTADCGVAPGEGCPQSGAGGEAGASGAGGMSGTGGVGGTGGAPAMGAGGSGGGAPACEAPAKACGAVCVDVGGDDAKHCGACDHDCGAGAACSKGACVPQALATGQLAPYALALGVQDVYWSSPAKGASGLEPPVVSARGKDGGGAVRSVFTFANNPLRARSRSLAPSADGKRLFWGSLNDNAIYSGDLQATPLPSAVPIENNEGDVQHAAFAAPKVYWVSGTSGAVRGKTPTAPNGSVDPEFFGQDKPGWVAIDEADAARPYWVAGLGARTIRRHTGVSDDVEEFASGAPLSVEIAGGRVYWADRGARELRSAPTSSATLPTTGTALVTGAGAVEGFVVDASVTPARVYWVSLDAAASPKVFEVWRANAADGSERIALGRVPVVDQAGYASNPFGPAYVRVDGTHVYFADAGTVNATNPADPTSPASDGVVYRVAK
jgi:hypothetical protein